MEIKNKEVNIQGLAATLLHRKTPVRRFRFRGYSTTQMRDMLIAACQAEVEYRMKSYNNSPAFTRHLEDVAEWLTSESDTRFGLFLSGGAGNGKTTILKAIQSLINLHDSTTHHDKTGGCIIVNAKELNRLAKAYYNPSRETMNDAEKFKRLKDAEILAIDDMGTEPREMMLYGDYITPLIDILSERYDKQACTLVTTNISAKDIGKFYDERIHDRMREMMKIINFSNEQSFR